MNCNKCGEQMKRGTISTLLGCTPFVNKDTGEEHHHNYNKVRVLYGCKTCEEYMEGCIIPQFCPNESCDFVYPREFSK